MISGTALNRDSDEHCSTGDLPLFAARDKALRNVVSAAERSDVLFLERAKKFVLFYLGRCGEASSEEITDAAKANGITPPDDRAFGPVYLSLSRRGLIVKAGFCLRKKGHLTSGGNLWRLA